MPAASPPHAGARLHRSFTISGEARRRAIGQLRLARISAGDSPKKPVLASTDDTRSRLL
jgi:hypothetical protein